MTAHATRTYQTSGRPLCKFCLLPDGHAGPHEVQRTVDQPMGATAALCRELDALSRRNEALDGEDLAKGYLIAELRVRVDELSALAASQADEIRSLNLQLDQARGRGGW